MTTNKIYFTILFILILVLVGLVMVALAAEAPELPIVQIRPLYDHLFITPQKWKDAYGDTLEVRLIYNIATLKNNQIAVARMIQKMHPPVDPNAPIDPNE